MSESLARHSSRYRGDDLDCSDLDCFDPSGLFPGLTIFGTVGPLLLSRLGQQETPGTVLWATRRPLGRRKPSGRWSWKGDFGDGISRIDGAIAIMADESREDLFAILRPSPIILTYLNEAMTAKASLVD
jgi:hypothetical protein